jgi:hypothetical protein
MVRSFVCSIVQSFVRSFVQIIIVQSLCYRNSDRSSIIPIHRSSFVHMNYSSFIVRSYGLFTVHRIIHSHYSSLFGLFNLLFIVHPIAQSFNYSSIMMISSPKTCQTNISVIRTPVTVIFLPVRTSRLVTHPRIAPS